MGVVKDDVTMAIGDLQLCGSLNVWREAAIHLHDI